MEQKQTQTNWYMEHEYKAKEKPFRMNGLFASFSYCKLKDREHFVHYVFGLESKGYGVGSVEEISDQALMVLGMVGGWKTMGKKSKLMTRAGLRNSQCHGSAMMNTVKGNLSDMVWDVVQANHQHGTPGVDKSCRILCS